MSRQLGLGVLAFVLCSCSESKQPLDARAADRAVRDLAFGDVFVERDRGADKQAADKSRLDAVKPDTAVKTDAAKPDSLVKADAAKSDSKADGPSKGWTLHWVKFSTGEINCTNTGYNGQCAHLVSPGSQPISTNNHCCFAGTYTDGLKVAGTAIWGAGQQAKLCHGNDNSICSNVVVIQ